MMTTEHLTVVQALTRIMGELPAIGKDAKSPEGYQYRGVEAITKHLQPLLAKHGVIIVPNATIVSVEPSPAMKDGWQDVYATVEWTIYGPDGSSITARTSGIGRDRADKGANKAQTQAFKYLLLHLLSIADKADDADGLTYEHDRYEKTADQIDTDRLFDDMKTLLPEVQTKLKAWAVDNKVSLRRADLEKNAAARKAIDDWLYTPVDDPTEPVQTELAGVS